MTSENAIPPSVKPGFKSPSSYLNSPGYREPKPEKKKGKVEAEPVEDTGEGADTP